MVPALCSEPSDGILLHSESFLCVMRPSYCVLSSLHNTQHVSDLIAPLAPSSIPRAFACALPCAFMLFPAYPTAHSLFRLSVQVSHLILGLKPSIPPQHVGNLFVYCPSSLLEHENKDVVCGGCLWLNLQCLAWCLELSGCQCVAVSWMMGNML